MNKSQLSSDPAEPDSLVALVPVVWDESQLDILPQTHPDIWAEPLTALESAPGSAAAAFLVGESETPITLHIDEAIPELIEMKGMAKQPFTPTESLQLEEHSAIWRLTMANISEDPVDRSHTFARLIATAVEAGAPGVFLPLCLQLHPGRLIKHLAVDFSQPPALINLFVNAWNDDEWMVTRGLTVFGLPEVETPIEGGLNDAYFRLMDVAAGMLLQRDAYPEGARLQLGPHSYTIEPGPTGPEDTMVPICGAYGRRSIVPA